METPPPEPFDFKQLARDSARSAGEDLLASLIMGVYWVFIVATPAFAGYLIADFSGLLIGAALGLVLGVIIYVAVLVLAGVKLVELFKKSR